MHSKELELFRSKTKIRGKTFSEKLNFVLSRWRKVVSDSESDNSTYRQDFAGIHSSSLSEVENAFGESQGIATLPRIRNLITTWKNNFGLQSAGAQDGLCYIVCELELVIEGQHDV